MSSLMQFDGNITWQGVGLEGTLHPANDPYGKCPEQVPCTLACHYRSHDQIYRFFRKPVGMWGCWVVFRYLGAKHVPGLSVPISLPAIPKGAVKLSPEENSAAWHRGEDRDRILLGTEKDMLDGWKASIHPSHSGSWYKVSNPSYGPDRNKPLAYRYYCHAGGVPNLNPNDPSICLLEATWDRINGVQVTQGDPSAMCPFEMYLQAVRNYHEGTMTKLEFMKQYRNIGGEKA